MSFQPKGACDNLPLWSLDGVSRPCSVPGAQFTTSTDPAGISVTLELNRHSQAGLQNNGQLGSFFLKSERQQLTAALSTLRGTRLLQVGHRESVSLAGCPIPHRIRLNGGDLLAQPEALPIQDNCLDALLLIHALEETPHPRQILQEAWRTLVPEGQLVIVGFNPWSPWKQWQEKPMGPTRSHLVKLSSLYDWLSTLHFSILGVQHFCFRPPLKNERLMGSLAFLETLGRWGWLPAGGGYLVTAQKRTIPLTPMPLELPLQPVVCRLRWAESSASEVEHG